MGAAAGDIQSLGTQNLWEITGQTLMRLGRSEESLTWLEKVYEKDAKKFGLLVIALAREKQFDRALELCKKAYQEEASAVAASLVVEVALTETNYS